MGLITTLLQAWIASGKSWTGAIVIFGTYAIQHYLPSLGMDKDMATITITTIVQAFGYVILIVGAIHKIIKGVAAKKAAAVGKVTGTADNTIPGGTILKILLGFVLLSLAIPYQSNAATRWDTPFSYIDHPRPDSAMKPTEGIVFVRPAYSQSFIGIQRGKEKTWEASILPGTGIGLLVERAISVNHEWYSEISLSFNALFQPIIDDATTFKFSGSVLLGTQLYGLGIIGAGIGFDGLQASAVIGYSGKIF
jgi:hypothetical protein